MKQKYPRYEFFGLKLDTDNHWYNPTTKNEKGVSNNGRFIPLTNRIREILDEQKAKQNR